jgi:thymidine kinase
MLKLLVGPMKAEKTGELIRLVKRASIGNKNVVVLSPQIDERTAGEVVESRNGSKVKAFRVKSSDLIENYTNGSVDIVFIDEIHLWDEGVVREICKLTDSGIDVVCSGLDMNYMSAPFEIVSRLLALADEVEKLTSVCEECGSDKGRRTARYINGKPASFNSPEILVDGTNTSVVYKTFCNKCYRKIGMFGLGGYPMKNVEIPETETAALNY